MTSAFGESLAKGSAARTTGASEVTRTFALVVGERCIVRGWPTSSLRFVA